MLTGLRLTATPAAVRAAMAGGQNSPVRAGVGVFEGRPVDFVARQALLEVRAADEPLARVDVPQWSPEGWGENRPRLDAQTNRITVTTDGETVHGELVFDKERGSLRRGRLAYWTFTDGQHPRFWLLRGRSTAGVTELKTGSPEAESVVTLQAGEPLRKAGQERDVRIVVAPDAEAHDQLIAALMCAGGFHRELVSRNEQLGRLAKWWAGDLFWGTQQAGPIRD